MDRRKEQRTDHDVVSPMQILLHVAGRPPFRGTLLDTSAAGAAVLLDERSAQGLEVSDPVELEVQVPGLARPLHLQSTVYYRVELDEAIRFVFRFTESGVLDRTIPYSLRPAFDRRAAPRVRLEERDDRAITLRLKSGRDLEGVLQDVSANGVSVHFAGELGNDLQEGAALRCFFTLPHTPTPFHLEGVVSRCHANGGEVEVGIQFECLRTPDYEDQGQALLDFVASYVAITSLHH